MKKIAALFLSLVLLFGAFTLSVQAAAVYSAEEIGLSLSIPEEYDVFTRDMPDDDPLYDVYGVTAEEVQSNLEESGLYFNVISIMDLIGFQLDTAPLDASLGDISFAALSDSFLEAELETFKEGFTDNFTILDSGILAGSASKWFWLSLSSEQIGDMVLFHTAENGMTYSVYGIHLTAGEPLSEEQIEAFFSILETAQFSEPVAAEPEPTVFEDAVYGTKITLPEHWIAEEINESIYESFRAKFIYEETSDLLSYYADDFEMVFPMQDRPKTRAECSQELLTEELFLQYYSSRYDAVQFAESVAHNGTSYLMGYGAMNVEEGEEVSFDTTLLLHMEDGILHSFEFLPVGSTSLSSPVIAPFLNAVEYDSDLSFLGWSTDNTSVSETSSEPLAEEEEPDFVPEEEHSFPWGVVIALIVLALLVVCIILVSKAKKKKNAQQDYTPIGIEPEVTEDTQENPAPLYCANCGEKLPPESRFCPGCGKPIE